MLHALDNNTLAQANTKVKPSAISANNDGHSLKNEFMVLMVAQIKNQDPSSPVKSEQYLSQLAQFSQVESLENVSKSQQAQVDSINNLNRVQSASLIGKQALIPASNIELADKPVTGELQLTASADVKVNLLNDKGRLVKTIDLGLKDKGTIPLKLSASDLDIPTGHYQIQVAATNNDHAVTNHTFFRGTIETVYFNAGQGSTTANISNGLGLTSILHISEIS